MAEPVIPPGILAQDIYTSFQQVRDQQIIITALVRMLGGSVTIATVEAEEAFRDYELTSYVTDEPMRIVLKVEEKQ